MTVFCPLSGSSNVELIEKVRTNDIIKIYEELLGFNISSELYGIEEIGFYYCKESNLRFFYPAVTGSESFYEELQKFDWYYLDDKAEYAYASNFIKELDSVLEIGSGKGAFAKKIKAQKYTGLEFSQEAKRLASMNGISILSESIQAHALANSGQYDVVCSFQVLEHIADINSFIQASIECLKPGGLLIYSVPSADSFLSVAKNNILNMPPHHVNWFSDICLTYMAEKFNLKTIDITHESLSDLHKRWYVQSIILERFCSLTGTHYSLIDRSIKHKILSGFAKVGGWLFANTLSNDGSQPNGHSVTIVYQK